MTRVRRTDFAELARPKREPNGFLRCEGYITRSGVFEYRRADGSTVREYRPPESVFARETLDSFELAPLTLEHPTGNLTPATVRDHQVGTIGRPARVGTLARASILITDPEAIRAVEAGELKQLSCGYECSIEEVRGTVHDSVGGLMEYDCVQRDIVGNHVALTSRGRAGASVALRADSEAVATGGTREDGEWTPTFVDGLPDAAFAVILPGGQIDSTGKTIPRSLRLYPHHTPEVTDPSDNDSVDLPMLREQIRRVGWSGLDNETRIAAETHLRAHAAALLTGPEEMARSDSMKVKVKVNGVEFEVDQAVAAHIQKQDSELGALTAQASAAKSEQDKLAGRMAALEAENAKRSSAEEQQRRADSEAKELERRFALIARAAAADPKRNLQEWTRMDSATLVNSIIKAERPEISLEGRSQDFLMGVFESLPQRQDTAETLQRLVSTAARKDAADAPAANGGSGVDDIEAARERMVNEGRNAWKRPQAEAK